MKRGPRMALGKVRRRELYHLPIARVVVLFLIFNFVLCDLNI